MAVGMSEQVDRTTPVLKRVREEFGERFVPSRVEAEREAVALLNARAGSSPARRPTAWASCSTAMKGRPRPS